MSFFSSVGKFFKDTVEGVVQEVAPGFTFTPSGILKQVGSLLPIVAEAIPGVGPLLKHAVPMVSAIFGGSERKENEEHPVLPNLDEVKKMLDASLTAISDTRLALENELKNLSAEIRALKLVETFEGYSSKVVPAIAYLNEQAPTFNTFTPFGGNAILEQYIGSIGAGTQVLSIHYIALDSVVKTLQSELNKDTPPTQAIFDLYILAVTWLLTYDKTMLNLRAYLAQYHLLNNTMTKYTECIASWNSDFRNMQSHAAAAVEFVLGKDKEKGIVDRLRQRRKDAILEIKNDDPKFEDTWPQYAVGYISYKKDEPLTKFLESKDLNQLKVARLGFQAISISYIEVSTQAAIEAAEIWKFSLYRWKSRIPLSPPTLPELNLVVPTVSPISDFKGEKVGLGWPTDYTLRYTVSYVTTYGEGFLGAWSSPLIIEGRSFVKIKIAPVVFPSNAFTDESHYPKQKNPKALEIDVVRRVYVIASFDDKVTTHLVGEVKAATTSEFEILDQARVKFPVLT